MTYLGVLFALIQPLPLIFFFQAEDGIRDGRVTGVQTCALPIFRPDAAMPVTALFAVVAYLIGSVSFAVVVSRAFGLPDPHQYGSRNPGATNVLRRSEERRVGKEWRSRWAPSHCRERNEVELRYT